MIDRAIIGIWKRVSSLPAISDFCDLRSDRFADAAAQRYRRDQIRGTLEQTELLILGNSLFAPIFAFQAAAAGSVPVLVSWTLAMVLASWGLYFWTKPLHQTTGARSDLIRMKVRAFIDGIMWSVGMACVYPFAEGDAKALVGIIFTGVIALGTFGYSRSVGVGMIFLATTSFGCGLVAFVTGLTVGTLSDTLVLFLSVFAFVALSKSVLYRGRAVLQSFVNVEKLSEKTEVVELLVKDYEAKATEWLWQTDAEGHLTAAPDLIISLLGGADVLQGEETLLRRVRRFSSIESECDLLRLSAAVHAQDEFHDIVLAFADPQTDSLRWVAVKGRPQFDDGVFLGFRGIVADTTKAVVAERQVQYLASFDSLTGLLNRNSVQERLHAFNPKSDLATAFLIDLDGFKQINDSYGHSIGDTLLEAVADRLRSLETNEAWAARLAGDEFLMVVKDHASTASMERLSLGQDICDRLSEPFQLDGFELQISASVGAARFPQDTDQGTDLLSLCDLALYDAKNSGRDRAHLFDSKMLEKLNQRIAIVEKLKRAVRNGQVHLHYQPQHCLSDGRLIGFESLARWTDDALGVVGPDVFIPIAEQTGLIVDLGESLLRNACRDALGWYKTLGPAAPVVSVNISPVQFARTDVAEMVASVLADTGLPPNLIEVEVTEGVLISDKARVANTLNELSGMGVSIALDDFGTGYSSLSYLQALPLNRLKIDRSFVNDLAGGADSSIVRTVIQLGQSLDLRVIAEGVETESQVEDLQSLGCDEGQGYFYNRPMPLVEANAYVDRVQRGASQVG